MTEKFKKLSSILEGKVDAIIEAVDKADPTTPEYKELLINFDVTMGVSSNVSAMLMQEEMSRNEQACKCVAPEEVTSEKVESEE